MDAILTIFRDPAWQMVGILIALAALIVAYKQPKQGSEPSQNKQAKNTPLPSKPVGTAIQQVSKSKVTQWSLPKTRSKIFMMCYYIIFPLFPSIFSGAGVVLFFITIMELVSSLFQYNISNLPAFWFIIALIIGIFTLVWVYLSFIVIFFYKKRNSSAFGASEVTLGCLGLPFLYSGVVMIPLVGVALLNIHNNIALDILVLGIPVLFLFTIYNWYKILVNKRLN